MFLSIDGVDGAGKSTQLGLLCDWLEDLGRDVVRCRDPGTTQLGEAVRDVLLNSQKTPIDCRAEMLLYMAARAQLTDQIIRPALEAGKTVVSDRFILANVVYQGHAGGLDSEEIWRIGQTATSGCRPRLTMVLDMDAGKSAQRIRRPPDRMEQRGIEYLERVRAGFLAEADLRPDDIMIIDAAQDVDQVQSEIRAAVTRVLGE